MIWANNDTEFLKLFNKANDIPAFKHSGEKKELAQFFTPGDVALFTSFNLLKDFNAETDIIFDPSIGKGSLLIACIYILNLRLPIEKIIPLLHGTEIDNETKEKAISIISDTFNLKEKEINLLKKNLKTKDFLKAEIPDNVYIITNPPYKETSEGNIWIKFLTKLSESKKVKAIGMIVPVSICSADRTLKIRENIINNFGNILALHTEIRPKPLFPRVDQRISILIVSKGNSYKTTGFIRFKNREDIWKEHFSEINVTKDVFPKVFKEDLEFIKRKQTKNFSGDLKSIWIRISGSYYLTASEKTPEKLSTKWKQINVPEEQADLILKLFKNGEALKWHRIFGDGRDFSIKKFLKHFPF